MIRARVLINSGNTSTSCKTIIHTTQATTSHSNHDALLQVSLTLARHTCLPVRSRHALGWWTVADSEHSFFKTLVNHEVTVELKNDISIRGTLKSVDQYLNIKLDDISVLDELKYPHLVSNPIHWQAPALFQEFVNGKTMSWELNHKRRMDSWHTHSAFCGHALTKCTTELSQERLHSWQHSQICTPSCSSSRHTAT